MPASPKPHGNVDRFGPSDVKVTPSAPSGNGTGHTIKSDKTESPKSNDTGPEALDLDDQDLSSLAESNQKIPYQRFREINEKKKELESQIANLQREFKQKLTREIENAEARAAAKYGSKKDDESIMDLEPWEKKIHSLNETLRKLESKVDSVSHDSQRAQLDSEISRLEAKYPDADVVSVLARKRLTPSEQLEELMERSHRSFGEKLEKKVRDMIEAKKKKSSTAIAPLRQLGISFEGEKKPETLKDAYKAIKKYAGLMSKN